ncbi:TlpA family protein disulfide reductase [Sphingobacterium suaedae]|uniref:TlpA family protein disulfide reductase n=1 Tax=Sphingobacterium suaedae TaxID=1686402 RepID=UPI00364058A4
MHHTNDTVLVFYQNDFDAITREMYLQRHEAILNPNGSFHIDLPVQGISEWVVQLGDAFEIIHLAPSKDVVMYIDDSNHRFHVVATGHNSEYINFEVCANKATPINIQAENYPTPSAYLQAYKDAVGKRRVFLDRYRDTTNFDPEYYTWLSSYYTYLPYERTLVTQVGDSLRGDPALNELLISEGLEDDYAAHNVRIYNDLVRQYIYYKFNGVKFPLSLVDVMDYLDKNPLIGGKTKEVFYATCMYVMRESNESVYEKSLAVFKKNVQDQELIRRIEQYRTEYLASKNKLEQVKIDQNLSLSTILNKYKGKIIYIDFWASWCGPCKMEMPNAAALKKRLNSPDVVFLYLGYQDSQVNWLKAKDVLQIEGEHYLLTGDMVKEANTVFGIVGIPHYAIIDRDGRIVDKQAKRPNDAYHELLSLLTNSK